MVKKAPNPVDRHVGSRVRMRRMMLSMSQEKLGDALGLTFQQVQKYEKGTNRIGASRLQQISNILQVPVAFLFDGAPDTPGSPRSAKDTPSPTYVAEFLATSDGLALTKAFMRIEDPKLRRRIVDLVQQIAGDDGGAGSRAAGQRDAGTALPDAKPQPVLAHELGDADIGALGKEAVVLQLRPKLGKRDGVGIVDEEGGVRIAHVGAHGILQGTETERQMIGVAGLADGNLAPVETCGTHVDGDHRQAVAAEACLLRLEQAGDGLHRDVITFALVHHHRGDAARGVAAGAGLAAIGIVDAHEDVGLAVGRALEHDQLVAAHAQPAVGDGAPPLGRELEIGRPRVEHDEVVAQPVHL